MKKTLFITALILAGSVLVSNAQIQRGNVLVGGDIANLNLGFGKDSKFSFQLNPKAAFFIRDNTALGPNLHLGLNTATGQGTDFFYGIGVLARQYVSGNAITDVRHARFFAEATVGVEGENHSKSSTNSTTNGLGLGVGPGIAYFITPNIGLEGLLKYQGIFGFGTTTTSNNLNLNVGLQVYLPTRSVRNAATNSQ
jgi:hypothetical protein